MHEALRKIQALAGLQKYLLEEKVEGHTLSREMLAGSKFVLLLLVHIFEGLNSRTTQVFQYHASK